MNVGLHALGLVLAAATIRPGTPALPLPERLQYLASRPWGWSLGWGVWMLCAMAFFAFLYVVRSRLEGFGGIAAPALALAGAAAGLDLACDTLFITLLPALAEGDASSFLAFERALGAVSVVVANGLYSFSVLLVTVSLPRAGRVWRAARILGLANFLAGMALTAAGFTGVSRHVELSAPVTILSYIGWVVAVARALGRAVGKASSSGAFCRCS